jgi:streptogramin lyase
MQHPKHRLILMTLLLTACGSAPTATTATEAATESIPSQTPEAGTVSPSNPLPAFDFSVDLEPVAVAGSYGFAEGPAVDPDGSVYFSDITAGKIYKWSPDGSVSVFLEGLNGPNGLMFDRNGNLIACEGGNGRLISIDPHGRITVLADQFNGLRFNEPNDLWIDPQGGIYFTDPAIPVAGRPGRPTCLLPFPGPQPGQPPHHRPATAERHRRNGGRPHVVRGRLQRRADLPLRHPP